MGETGITALDHLGLIVADARHSATVFAELSGLPAPAIRDNHAEGMRARDVRYRGEPIGGGTLAAWFTLAAANVNLMEPTRGRSPWREFLDAHGPGGCYLAFAVDDVPATLAELAALGYPTVQTGRTASGSSYGYGDARAELGVYLEILPARAGPGGAGTRPDAPGGTAPPELRSVGLVVNDAEQASSAWACVLGSDAPTVRDDGAGGRRATLDLPAGVTIEVTQPGEGATARRERLERHGADVHDFVLARADADQAARALQGRGYAAAGDPLLFDATADLGVFVGVREVASR